MTDIKGLIFEITGGATITALFSWLIWSCYMASINAVTALNFWYWVEMIINH